MPDVKCQQKYVKHHPPPQVAQENWQIACHQHAFAIGGGIQVHEEISCPKGHADPEAHPQERIKRRAIGPGICGKPCVIPKAQQTWKPKKGDTFMGFGVLLGRVWSWVSQRGTQTFDTRWLPFELF